MPEATHHTLTLVSGSKRLTSALGEILPSLGWTLLSVTPQADLSTLFKDHRPTAVAVDTDDPAGVRSLENLGTTFNPLSLIAVCSAANRPAIRRRLRGQVYEFVNSPFDPEELEPALDRIVYVSSLTGSATEEQRVATERFLGIRQVIDKLSSFISMVATDVQGGIKYFNELPYFVSIHSNDCQVLAANNTYTKYLGNRIYKNSWEIYSGKRSTRNGCPVGRALKAIEVRSTRALVRYKSGARVPVTVHTAPIYDDNGHVSLVLEVFAGTKEIEKLASEIKNTQQRYEQLFDAVPSQLVVVDRRFRITAANRKFLRNFGDQVGRNFFQCSAASQLSGLPRPGNLHSPNRATPAGRDGHDGRKRYHPEYDGLDLAHHDSGRETDPGTGYFRRHYGTAPPAAQSGIAGAHARHGLTRSERQSHRP